MVIPWAKCAAQNRALQAALAAERYRLEHGKWPTKLEDVSPAFLQKVPVDPFDEKPIRYTIWSDGIKVWCVGENQSDDGGDVGWRDYSTPKTKKYSTDWGWVILNPELRGRTAPTATTQNTMP